MSEKTERQSIDTGNIEHKTHRMKDKQNKKHDTEN